MKLVAITHYRCGEPDGHSFLLAKDDLTEEQFEKDVSIAQSNYLAKKEEFKTLREKPKYLSKSINDYPDDITILQAKKLINKNDEDLKKWREEEAKYSRTFLYYMYDLWYKNIYDYDDDEVLNVYADWGHEHGENLNYSQKIDSWDLL